MAAVRFALAVPRPFDLEVALFGHGWIDLAPHAWDAKERRFTTALSLLGAEDGTESAGSHDAGVDAADVDVVQRGASLRVTVDAAGAPAAARRARTRAALRRMLRLDHDYAPFWRRCDETAELRWVARRGAGRLLAGASLFEDLLKLLFTTNCSWAATRGMTQRLVDALGPRAPSGRAAFPSAERCAREPERFWRDVVHAGYRARAARELSAGFASGALRDEQFTDPGLPTDEVRRRLLALHGIGPYAAGQAMRLLGRHEDLALDSWCRAKLARTLGRKLSDRAIERRYARHGADRGLVLWMELTADWHGEAADRERDRVLASFRNEH
jgi:N-glycosylase/DNA lyase